MATIMAIGFNKDDEMNGWLDFTGCVMHRSESCNGWEPKEEQREAYHGKDETVELQREG
jgi:hypothetical protein